jgi:phosphatidylglycerophosphatase A
MNTSPAAKVPKNKSRERIPARRVFTDPYCFLGFGFGTGLAPIAPGTFGTLAAIPLYLALSGLSAPLYGAIVVGLFLIGVPICQRCEDRLGVSDHGGIVWDEIVGYLITLTAVPFSWPAAGLGFVLFRIFDILKPWPIKRLDRTLHGGFGVMLDDAVAGLFAAACLHLLLPFIGG